MHQGRRSAEQRRGGGKPAGEVGDFAAVEKVALAIVLGMHQRIRC
jgi:hypothetical protein